MSKAELFSVSRIGFEFSPSRPRNAIFGMSAAACQGGEGTQAAFRWR